MIRSAETERATKNCLILYQRDLRYAKFNGCLNKIFIQFAGATISEDIGNMCWNTKKNVTTLYRNNTRVKEFKNLITKGGLVNKLPPRVHAYRNKSPTSVIFYELDIDAILNLYKEAAGINYNSDLVSRIKSLRDDAVLTTQKL